jgi:hypothetical protein
MNRKKRTPFALIVCIAAFFATTMLAEGVMSKNTAGAAETGIRVRVLLFSGRPDPTFVLEDRQVIEKLKNSLTKAKKAVDFKQATVIPSILGYKGILIENPEMAAGLPRQLAVYKGTIEVTDGQKRFLVDEQGALEKMLMDASIRKGVIDEVILKRMRKEQ